MANHFGASAIGAHSHPLPRGPRVRLRLAQIRDVRAIEALVRSQGLDADELEVARLVQSDPRRRITVCAGALLRGADTIVGFGAIEVGATHPATVFVDQELTEGLAELIADALQDRSAAISDRLAA